MVLFPQNGSPLDIRNVNDLIVLDKIDIGIGIGDHQGFISCVIIDGGDPDIRKAIDFVDPLNAVILFIRNKRWNRVLRNRSCFPPLSQQCIGNKKMVSPLTNTCCLCKTCDPFARRKNREIKEIPHRTHEIKIKKNKASFEYSN